MRSSRASRRSASPTASSTPQSTSVARGLLARGLAVGDRLGMWAPNRSEWTLVQYASAKLGVILVNVNPAYGSSEVAYALRQSGCRALVAARGFRDTDYAAHARRGALRAPRARVGRVARHGRLGRVAGRGRGGAAGRRARPRARPAARRRDQHPVHERHDGLPEGRRADAPQHPQQRLPRRTGLPLQRARPHLHPGARSTTASAWSWATSARRRTARAWSSRARASTPARRSRRSPQERCTSLYGVPTMFIAELGHPSFAEHDLSSLRTGIMAGSPCPVEIMRRVVREMSMAEVTICYGMTETSPVSTQSSPDDPLELRVSTVGRVHPHLEVKLVDPATRRDRRARRAPASCARAATPSCAATGTTRSARARSSTPTASCTRATSRRWTSRATSTSSAAART